MKNIDDILKKIGEFGRYQKRIFFALLSFPCVFVGAFSMILIVTLYTPAHRCKIPSLPNDTYAVQDEQHLHLINLTIPPHPDPMKPYDMCYYYDYKGPHFEDKKRNRSKVACSEWVYDKRVFKETFTSKINLVCTDSLKTSHIMMFFYFGLLVGDLILGMISDAFGRKTGLCIAWLVAFLSSVAVSFVPEFYSFAILHFIIGGSVHGGFVCLAVLSMEMVGPTKRLWTGMLIQVFFAIGVCYLALMGFLIRTWMWINLSVALPCAAFLTYWWLVPESFRWLFSKGRRDEAVKLVEKTAKVNKTSMPELMLTEHQPEDKEPVPEGNILHVLRSPILLRRTIIMSFNWLVVSMTYYGTTMNAGRMGGSFYLNFFLMGAAEIPGLFLGMAILNRLGRRWSNAGMIICGGIACVATIPTVLYGGDDLQPLTNTLALIGKAMSAGAFGILYIFTAEINPTVVRNAVVGFCSMAARVGSMIAPYVAKSGELLGGKYEVILPLVIFGALSIVAGLLLFLIPETFNKKLPDTLKEGEEFGRKVKQPAKATELPHINQDNDLTYASKNA